MPRTYQEALNELREYTKYYVHDLNAGMHLNDCLDQLQSMVDNMTLINQTSEEEYRAVFHTKENKHETKDDH